MNQPKKNQSGFKSTLKVNLIRSKSTDQLNSNHKNIGHKQSLQKPCLHGMPIIKASNLSKSKSTKSLKNKHKSSTKLLQVKIVKNMNNKKKRNALSDCKTVKKSKKLVEINFEEQSFNSQASIKQQKPLGYFLYQNAYIPIQNSAQRRFVVKIKQIDMKNFEFTQNFLNKHNDSTVLSKYQIEKKQIQEHGIGTDKLISASFGTNTTPRHSQQISIQTQLGKLNEDIKKCFSSTLNDLEFLFLPDENNFREFSTTEKLHYRELFETIARKIWANGENLQQLTDEKIQIAIYQRECIQMGMIDHCPRQGFPTHIFSVMGYLTNLFSFSEINQKHEIVQKIHNIFGFSYQERLSRLLRAESTKACPNPILSQAIFLSLQKQLFKDYDFVSQLVEKSVHIHNKAIFDCVNEELQKFKPFYFSKGEPFPWSLNASMTFFTIDSSTLSLLFKQIKQKILMKFGYLCGILVDYENYEQTQNRKRHPLHLMKLKQHQKKMAHDQVEEQTDRPDFEEFDTMFKSDLAKQVSAELISQLCQDLSFLLK